MKTFSSIVVVKHPRELVWTTIRDHLPELTPFLDDIDAISVSERDEEPNGTVRLVNLWKASPPIPALLSSVLDPEMLAWVDRAEYQPQQYECHWQIEPRFFPDRTRCAGVTRYETALGGRGTKITFSGGLGVAMENLAGVPAFMEGTVRRGVESFVTTLIPKNFRRLTDALSQYLTRQGV
ncbi:MAG: hypothetical protein ACKV2V_15255 [Blastocatellia bacterium]